MEANTAKIPWHRSFKWWHFFLIGIVLLPFTDWAGLFLIYGLVSLLIKIKKEHLISKMFQKIKSFFGAIASLLGGLFIFTLPIWAILLIFLIPVALWNIHPVLGIISIFFLFR